MVYIFRIYFLILLFLKQLVAHIDKKEILIFLNKGFLKIWRKVNMVAKNMNYNTKIMEINKKQTWMSFLSASFIITIWIVQQLLLLLQTIQQSDQQNIGGKIIYLLIDQYSAFWTPQFFLWPHNGFQARPTERVLAW